MADDFKSTDWILLQPRSEDNAYTFYFPAATEEYARGGIPYGLTISSASVSATNQDTGADVTSSMITTGPEVTDSYYVTVGLTWVAAGNFKLTFVLTLSDSSVYEFDFSRVIGKDN